MERTPEQQLAKAVAVFCEMFAALSDPEHQFHEAIKTAPREWSEDQVAYGRNALQAAGFDQYGDESRYK